MKKISYRSLVAVLVLAFGLTTLAVAQPTQDGYPTKFAQAGMAFLKIDVGSRIAAMGGTHASVTGSVYDMFSNPAGLAFAEGLQASTTVTNWIADIKHYGAGISYRAGSLGTFGLSFVAMDYGDFTRTVPYEGADLELRNQGYLTQGTFTVNEFAVGLAYGRQITNQFYVGGHVRYAEQDLGEILIFDQVRGQEVTAENNVNNLVFDFGTMYYTGWQDLRFGMSLRNFSSQSDYYDQRFELPLTFDFGVAIDLMPFVSPSDNQNLLLAVNWLHPRDFSERLHAGVEYGLMDTFFLRGGYKFNYDEESFSGGLGAKLDVSGYGIQADYAYTAFGEFFGSVHRVTLGVFGL